MDWKANPKTMLDGDDASARFAMSTLVFSRERRIYAREVKSSMESSRDVRELRFCNANARA